MLAKSPAVLQELKVKNLAILPQLSISLGKGLNVLTGETGAGKSILVDSIGLLAGQRASALDIRQGEEMAEVEGLIEVVSPSMQKKLGEGGIVFDRELILRRMVSSDGRSRAFINETSWTISGLSQLAEYWIDISGQHGQSRLMDESQHVDLLDQFAQLSEPRSLYEKTFQMVRKIDEEILRFREDREKSLRERDYWLFQKKELGQAEIRIGEKEELETLHRRFANSEKLANASQRLAEALDGDEGLAFHLGKMALELSNAEKLDETLSRWHSQVRELEVIVDDLRRQISDYQGKLEFDPEEVERINERLALLQNLSRKYGSIEKAVEEREKILLLLENIENFEDREKELLTRREEFARQLQLQGEKLSHQRQKKSKEFCDQVSREFQHLGMSSAKLRMAFSPPSSENHPVSVKEKIFGPKGAEEVRMEFAPNPGEGFRPLASIASGGELSRILLAIKSLLMTQDPNESITFLFDEVDSGIGGETAERVGIRLKHLAQKRQVLCVTHLAQIACYADHHFLVQKTVRSGRTTGEIKKLNVEQRQEELARMIGGIQISEKTMAHARELLDRGSQISTGAF